MIKKILSLFMILSTAAPQCSYISLSATVCDCGRPHFFVSSIPARTYKRKGHQTVPLPFIGRSGGIYSRVYALTPNEAAFGVSSLFRLCLPARSRVPKIFARPHFFVGSIPARTYKKKGHQTVPLPFIGRSGGI